MITDIYTLTPMQQAMLFHALSEPGTAGYYNVLSVTIKGPLHAQNLKRAWANLVARHAILRTSFQWADLEEPVQVVHEQSELDWREETWSEQGQALETRWQALLEADREQGFELDKLPLLRCRLIRLKDQEHRFFWSHHHIILDGSCQHTLFKEMEQAYRAYGRGEQPGIAAIPPFRDYIQWLRQQDGEATAHYWAKELKGIKATNQLTVMEREHQEQGKAKRNTSKHKQLTESQTQAITEWAQAHSLTQATILSGALAILLARYIREPDITLGVTLAGRPAQLPGAMDILGPFLNTLPSRYHVESSATLTAWMQAQQARAVLREENGYCSLSEVRKAAGYNEAAPLFETLFVAFNYENYRPQFEDLELSDIAFFAQSNLPLSLWLTPGPAIQLEINYDANRFEGRAIARMLGHLQTLLEGFTAAPQESLASYPLLTQAEREHYLQEINGTARPFDYHETVAQRIEKRAQQCPTKQAIRYRDETLDYQTFDQRANAIARQILARVALEPDDVVVILTERSDRLATIIMAVWKSGAAYTPIDPNYPAKRILKLIETSQPRMVITETGQVAAEVLTKISAQCPVILADTLDQKNTEPLTHSQAQSPHELAYVIYTSGSTGKPKGVMIEQVGMTNHMLAKIEDLELDEHSVIAQNAPQCFDISIWQTFAALIEGGETVIYDDETVLDGTALLQAMERDRVTVLELVPSYLQVLIEKQAADQTLTLPYLRYLISNAEYLAPTQVTAWLERYPHTKVVNAYGLTEASDDTHHYTMDKPPEEALLPVGRLLRNCRGYIVDEAMNLCPYGVKGEILLAGIGVGRGYRNEEERTAQVRIKDSYKPDLEEYMWRSGDVASLREDGNYYFYTRSDYQVKYRGHRIELGEIEATLLAVDNVRQAAVELRNEGEQTAHLAAYVSQWEPNKTSQELIKALREELPEYMIPTSITHLESLPLNDNGKIARNQLPAPEREPDAAAIEAPRNQTETLLTEIWAEVLGIARIGIKDNFFELGGDSIAAMRIATRATSRGLQLGPGDIFNAQEVAALAQRIQKTPATQSPATQSEETQDAPLLPIQMQQLARKTGRHDNQSVNLEVPPETNPQYLAEALLALIQKHAILRTRYRQEAGQWRRNTVEAPQQAPFQQEDFTALPKAEQEEALTTAMARIQKSLDPFEGTLLRLTLFTLPKGQKARLFMVIHHLAVDRNSWPILLADLQHAYRRVEAGQAPSTEPEQMTHALWAQRLKAEDQKDELAYWTTPARAAVTPLPQDKGAPDGGLVGTAKRISRRLDRATTHALQNEMPKRQRVTVEEAMLTALAMTLNSWQGQRGILVEVESHGRQPHYPELEVETGVGWFTAVYPHYIKLDTDEYPAALAQVSAQMRKLPSAGLGYGQLRYYGTEHIRTRLAEMPQAQILFNYMGAPQQEHELGMGWKPAGEDTGPEQSPEAKRDYKIEINAITEAGNLEITWDYDPEQYEVETVAKLLDQYSANLEKLATNQAPALPIEADTYPLTPMQQGMLYHSASSDETQQYQTQFTCIITGPLDEERYRSAWEQVIERHTLLRTSFHWQEQPYPQQKVQKQVQAPWTKPDWRGQTEQEQIKAHQQEEMRQGFALDRAPLMRFTLARQREDRRYFSWSRHHLIIDGWSSAIILDEVMAIYNQEPHRLKEPKPFRDYIDWLAKQDLTEAETYWRKRLAGSQGQSTYLAPTVNQAEHGSGRSEHRLTAADTQALGAYARKTQVTHNTLYQAAWAILQARYDDTPETQHGTVVSGRSIPFEGIEERVGVFINSLPVRVHIRQGETLRAWMQQLQRDLTEQERYAMCSITQIQQWTEQPTRPLFETLLINENYPINESLQAEIGELTLTEVTSHETNDLPLSLFITGGERIGFTMLYQKARIEQATVARILQHLEQILLAMIAEPNGKVTQIEILTPAERARLSRKEPPTTSESQTLAQRIERIAATHPSREAIRYGQESQSYAELKRAVNGMAQRMRPKLQPESVVALIAPRTPRLIAAILAIWQNGAVYMPIDPSNPQQRIDAMLQEAQPALVIGEASPEETPISKAWPYQQMTTEPADEGQSRASYASAQLAYIIYTSGTTGKPKGAMVTQAGMSNHIEAMVQTMKLTEASRVAQTATHSFDISIWQMLAALSRGGTTVIYPDELIHDPPALLDAMTEDRITAAQLVPSYLTELLEAAAQTGKTLDHLERLACIGEELKPDHQNRWHRQYPEKELINTYGPTECADSVLHQRTRAKAQTVPLGKPIHNMNAYVLDRNGNQQPEECRGMLWLEGEGVGRGYYRNPRKTAEAYCPNPYAGTPGARMYRSGDLAKRGIEGEYYYSGRNDHQLKIRGYRIECGEVENHLQTHEQVKQAVVMAQQDGEQISLTAYLEVEPGTRSQELEAYLLTRLPAYMNPDHYVCLEKMPRLPSRKIDRAALAQAGKEVLRRNQEPASNETEETLQQLWREVLGHDNFGVTDTFFEVGGQSLLTMRLAGQISRAFGVRIAFTDVIRRPTVRLMAEKLAYAKTVEDNNIPPLPQAPDYPLSHAQKGIWLACTGTAASQTYHMQGNYSIHGPLNQEQLSEAFQKLVERHEGLRTRIRHTQGQPRQVIDSPEQARFQMKSTEQPGANWNEIIEAEAARPINLAEESLFRVQLVRKAEEEHLLIATLHHIVGDAWTLGQLLRELNANYTAIRKGRPIENKPPEVTYRAYAAWQNTRMQKGQLKWQQDYWREKLRNLSRRTEIPADYPGKGPGAAATEAMPPWKGERLAQLEARANQHGTTRYVMVAAAAMALAYRHTENEDVVIGTQIADRSQPGLEEVVGCFLNTLVLRQTVQGDETLTEHLDRTKQNLEDAWEHQEWPYAQIVAEHQPQRKPNQPPYFDIQLDYVPKIENKPGDDPGIELHPIEGQTNTAQYPISLLFEDAGERINGYVVYDTKRYRASTAKALAEQYDRILDALSQGTGRIDEIQLIDSPDEEAATPIIEISLNF